MTARRKKVDRLDLATATGLWVMEAAGKGHVALDLDAWKTAPFNAATGRALDEWRWLRLDYVEARAEGRRPKYGEVHVGMSAWWAWLDTAPGEWHQGVVTAIRPRTARSLPEALLPRRRPRPPERLALFRAYILETRANREPQPCRRRRGTARTGAREGLSTTEPGPAG